jgi:hypothetical protein
MPDFTIPAPSLEAVMPVFYQHGLQHAPDEALANALNISTSFLQSRFPNRTALVHQAMLADLVRQKREHAELYTKYPSAVERLYGLLQLGLRDLSGIPARFYNDLQSDFPDVWGVVTDHLAGYSTPQLHQLLNDGIRSRLFRSDINISLVTKILIEQLNLLLNPLVFPPDRYNMSEVFRSIFLYYIRGLCTDEGARVAAEHFSRI